jgi:MFS family permease
VVGRFGWRPFFLVLGLGSLVWLIPWVVLMPKRARIVAHAVETKIRILDIVRQRSAWGTMLGQFAVNYCLYFLVTWLPSYLTRGRHFSMDQMARTGGLIFLLFAISAMVCGKFSDRYIEHGGSPTVARKSQLGFGMLGLGISLATAAVASDTMFVWALLAAGISMGMCGGCTWTVAQTLGGPWAAGRWAGVQNFVGNLAGGVGPMLTGYLVGLTGKFYWPFFIAAIIAWLGAVGWVFIVGPIETVDWEKVCGARGFRIGAPAADGARP